MHDQPLIVNELIWEFYMHLDPSMKVQPIFSMVREQVVRFSSHEIWATLPIKETPVDNSSLDDIVARTQTGS